MLEDFRRVLVVPSKTQQQMPLRCWQIPTRTYGVGFTAVITSSPIMMMIAMINVEKDRTLSC